MYAIRSYYEPHNFLVHNYGRHIELVFHVKLPGELSLNAAHQIATNYEELIKERLQIEVNVHIEN